MEQNKNARTLEHDHVLHNENQISLKAKWNYTIWPACCIYF